MGLTGATQQALAFGCGMDQPVMEQVALCGGHTHPTVNRRYCQISQAAGRPSASRGKASNGKAERNREPQLLVDSIAFHLWTYLCKDFMSTHISE